MSCFACHKCRRRKQRENLASLTASDNPEKESKPLEKLVLKRDSVDGQEWSVSHCKRGGNFSLWVEAKGIKKFYLLLIYIFFF